ncbi:MAG: hypothetical protein IJQ34_03090 [Kiritimatiellae bacterium]|nr:hypothetical protein [Kiritimatiellia bacterium]
MKKRNSGFIAAGAILLVLVIGVAAYFFFTNRASRAQNENDLGNQGALVAQSGNESNSSSYTRKTPRKKVKTQTPFGEVELEVEDEWEDYAPEDQRRMEAMEIAMSEENLDSLIAMIPDVMASTNSAVRKEIVDSLDWFGEKAALELLPFMADSDEEVAGAAADAWQRAISEVEDEKYKLSLVENSMMAIKNKDALETICDELIGGDDLAALQVLINIIGSENEVAREVAIEQYSFITGEDYVDFQTAEQWVQENLEDLQQGAPSNQEENDETATEEKSNGQSR